jgi:hypothetical protein
MKGWRLFSFVAVILILWGSAAGANIIYTTLDDSYTNGSAGVIIGSSSPEEVISGLGGDPHAYTFKDHDGNWRALLTNSEMSKNDEIMVFTPSNWRTPVANKNNWGVSIQGAVSYGDFLYVIAYASGTDGSEGGGVFRVNMRDGYELDKSATQAESGGVLLVGDAVTVSGGKICVLFSSRKGVFPDLEYEPSVIIVYNDDLSEYKRITLQAGGEAALNTYGNTLAADTSGSLYVTSLGKTYSEPHGRVWKVTNPTGSAAVSKILDVDDITDISGTPGVDGIEITDDGTMYLLVDGYGEQRLFITDTASPSWENQMTSVGSGILYDNDDDTLWCVNGGVLDARDKSGTLKKSHSAAALGDNIYTVAAFGNNDNDDDDDDDDGNGNNSGNDDDDGASGGGCASGAGAAALLALIGVMKAAPRKR